MRRRSFLGGHLLERFQARRDFAIVLEQIRFKLARHEPHKRIGRRARVPLNVDKRALEARDGHPFRRRLVHQLHPEIVPPVQFRVVALVFVLR